MLDFVRLRQLPESSKLLLTKGTGLAAAYAALPMAVTAEKIVSERLGSPKRDKTSPIPYCRAGHDRVNLAVGMVAGYGGSSAAKRLFGTRISGNALIVGELIDTSVTLGAMVVASSEKGQAKDKRGKLEALFERLGMPKESAHCASHTLTSFVLPETLGTGAGLMYLIKSSAPVLR